MEQGCWRGKWFPSTMITTYYAVRFLHHMGERYDDTIQKAKHWILVSQEARGSWNQSVIETSAAILR
jgi:squalene cyclase